MRKPHARWLRRLWPAAALLLAVPAAAGERLIEAGPERVWTALAARAGTALAGDDRRYEGRLALAATDPVAVSVDWDEHSGLTRLSWRGPGESAPALAGWMEGVAAAAARLPQRNRYCRGLVPDPRHDDVPEPSIDAAIRCGMGTGNFSSALLELEKCGDHETTLRLLGMCARENHAGGLVRIAQLYETGSGVPQRPERMTHFLARAAAVAKGDGYRRGAITLYATALYFGVGTAPDRPRALALFRTAAGEGDADAAAFLRTGSHSAWRRTDGSLFRDPDFDAGVVR